MPVYARKNLPNYVSIQRIQPAIIGALRAHWTGMLNATVSHVVDALHVQVGILGNKQSTKLPTVVLR